jgi:hypothetical protein
MADWQSRLEGLTRWGRDIPEPGNVFAAPKPMASPWPKGLPTIPVLSEFYARCNGCLLPSPIGVFQILPRGKLAPSRSGGEDAYTTRPMAIVRSASEH